MKIVYVMGTDRSGSTVLDLVLGNHDRIVSTGELTSLVRHGWSSAVCSCGEERDVCPFWKGVRERLESSGQNLNDLSRLESQVDRIRRLRSLQSSHYLQGPVFQSWLRGNQALFRAIQAESGATAIIDSSKHPARGLALQSAADLDVFVLHLVRDGRAYTWSLAKSFLRDREGGVEQNLSSRSVLRAVFEWTVINRSADRIGARLPLNRFHRIRYEDYVSDPAKTLAPVMEFLGEQNSTLLPKLTQGASLDTGHLAAGNRLRTSMNVVLKPDLEWRERLSPAMQRIFWNLTASRMKRYGYAKEEI